ncbi:MAG: hypothetical protein IPL27_03535 [Lewinellaceae bacterium]|nr:hypothetical protein [Lewinellaceae bacterium]
MDAVYDNLSYPVGRGCRLRWAAWKAIRFSAVCENYLSFTAPDAVLRFTVARRVNFYRNRSKRRPENKHRVCFAGYPCRPAVNLRGGVLMRSIGTLTGNRDGPKPDFITRPDTATQMLPATLI